MRDLCKVAPASVGIIFQAVATNAGHFFFTLASQPCVSLINEGGLEVRLHPRERARDTMIVYGRA